MYRFVFFVLILAAVHAEFEVNEPCNLTNVPRDYIIFSEKSVGTWYQLARIPNSVDTGDCARSVFGFMTIEETVDGDVTNVTSGYKYDAEVTSGKLVTRNGTITMSLKLLAGYIEVTYEGNRSQTYLVLGTDFTEYLVLYSCQDSGKKSLVSAWTFGRNTTYSEAAINKTAELIKNANLGNATWRTVSHSADACKSTGVDVGLSPLAMLLVVGMAFFKKI